MHIKKFFCNSGTLVAFFITILLGSMVFWIYDSGYKNMPQNIKELPITIVNQDTDSKSFVRQLKSSLPFKHINETTDLKTAKKDLDTRESYLIINIPKHFSNDVVNDKSTKIHFYINDSNQLSVVSSLNLLITKLSNSINNNISVKKNTLKIATPALKQLQHNLKAQQLAAATNIATAKAQIAQAPSDQQEKLAAQLTAKVQKQQKEAKVHALKQKTEIIKQSSHQAQKISCTNATEVHYQNRVKKGLNNYLAPLFINLALNLGAMIGAMVLYNIYLKFADEFGKLEAFAYLELAYVLFAVIGSILLSAINLKILPIPFTNYFSIVLNHTLSLFLFYNFNTVLLLLFGQAGAPINTILTMIQVVSGTGAVPLLGLNKFFAFMHYLSPLYYATQNDFNLLYGGITSAQQKCGFSLLIIGTLCINLLIVTIKHKQPVLNIG
ncbi:ABC transporter permease [Lactobacillus bombicola]|uniref:ABC transporter permease n=1 Tax=Lactobacillus bombicola TaxID=1505723 RepID=UPI0015FA89BC|nr:ABC transporter permease [Lactobacillus bombicola]